MADERMNRFLPCASVLEGHAILLDDHGNMIYAGRLGGISEVDFNRASTTLVSPQTQAWIKDKADAAVRSGKVRLQ